MIAGQMNELINNFVSGAISLSEFRLWENRLHLLVSTCASKEMEVYLLQKEDVLLGLWHAFNHCNSQ